MPLDTIILFPEKPSERAQQPLNLTGISLLSLILPWDYLPLVQNSTDHLLWKYNSTNPIMSLIFLFVRP